MDDQDLILGRALKFVTLANKALKRSGEEGETEFQPSMLKISIHVEPRGNTLVTKYRAAFGPFMLHHNMPSLPEALDALEEVINTYGL
jgi:hypothetical protein